MSTNSQIGILSPTGQVYSVYCHWDGYPSWMGKLLTEHHNSEMHAVAILSNSGYYSSLGETLEPAPEVRSSDSRYSDFGLNEDTREVHATPEAFYHATLNCGGEWAYLWDTLADCWVCTKVDQTRTRKTKGQKGITWSKVTPEWIEANPS